MSPSRVLSVKPSRAARSSIAVRLQDVTVERPVAGRSGRLAQALEERAAEAFALPGVGHSQRKLGGLAVGVGRIAPHSDEAALVHGD